jgi:hypothetical protein
MQIVDIVAVSSCSSSVSNEIPAEETHFGALLFRNEHVTTLVVTFRVKAPCGLVNDTDFEGACCLQVHD